MRNFFGQLLILVSPFLFGQTNDPSSVDTSGDEPLPFLNADFFADSLPKLILWKKTQWAHRDSSRSEIRL